MRSGNIYANKECDGSCIGWSLVTELVCRERCDRKITVQLRIISAVTVTVM